MITYKEMLDLNNETLRNVAIVSLPFKLEVSNYNCHKRISLWENSKKIPQDLGQIKTEDCTILLHF